MILKRAVCLALIAACLCSCAALCACSDDGGDTILKVGGMKVPYEMYRYFYFNTKANAGGEEEGLLDKVAHNIKSAYAVIPMAKHYKVSLSSEEEKAIDRYISEQKASFGDDNVYYDSMELAYQSDYTFKKMLELQQLRAKLFESLIDEFTGDIDCEKSVVMADIHKNFYRTLQIFISNDSGDDKEANQKLAYELYERAKNGEDFYTLVNEYGEDPALYGNKDGHYATVGQKIAEYEDVALALKPGEMSEVVETYLGYHIILRLELEDEYIDTYYEDMLYLYQNRKFNEIYNQYMEEMDISYGSKYYKIDYAEMEAYKIKRNISTPAAKTETETEKISSAEGTDSDTAA